MLEHAVQISDGLKNTCADGASLAFDSKYGIMFCAYMPGFLGDYGESRGKIALSYFPAAQPTNIRYVEVSSGNEEYVPNILSLGDGKVRVFYEKYSRAPGDHPICYKDFDFVTEHLGEERQVMLRQADGTLTPLGLSHVFAYLENQGYHNHVFLQTEQIIFGGCTLFREPDGTVYGALSGELSETVLYRSQDNLATIEFFAVFPHQVQYEFDYLLHEGKIWAIYRTNQEPEGIYWSVSENMGRTWQQPEALPESIQCRPRIVLHNGKVLMAYNYFNNRTENRPEVIMGRTAIRFCVIEKGRPVQTRELHSKYGIVNISLLDLLGDLYMAFSTSVAALYYQNGSPWVRGKDAVRYICLGNMSVLTQE